jgi:hypothetical protein
LPRLLGQDTFGVENWVQAVGAELGPVVVEDEAKSVADVRLVRPAVGRGPGGLSW